MLVNLDIEEEYRVKVVRDAVSGIAHKEVWTRRGQKVRLGAPAERIFDRGTGALISEIYFKEGELHRCDGPSIINYDPTNGSKIYEAWLHHSEYHRDGDLPAVIFRDPLTKVVYREEYFWLGAEHRSTGPALVEWDPDSGEKVREVWKQNNQLHRSADLPALTEWDAGTGEIILEQIWIEDELVNERRQTIQADHDNLSLG